MIRRILHSDNFRVGLVTVVCIAFILVVTANVLRVPAEIAIFGPTLLFLGYLVSFGWTPVPDWSPVGFWSLAILLTTFVEIVFAYLK